MDIPVIGFFVQLELGEMRNVNEQVTQIQKDHCYFCMTCAAGRRSSWDPSFLVVEPRGTRDPVVDERPVVHMATLCMRRGTPWLIQTSLLFSLDLEPPVLFTIATV